MGMTTKNTKGFHYKTKDGVTPVENLTEEHLVKAMASVKKRADDHYRKSMDLANIYSELIMEYERRHPEVEDVEEHLKQKRTVQSLA